VGPLSFDALMGQFGSATVILENWEDLPKKFQKKIILAPLLTIEEELENSLEFGIALLTYLDPQARGPNHLLKQGAILVENFQDILQVFPAREDALLESLTFENIKDPEISPNAILDHLSPVSLSINDLLQATGLPLTSLWPALLDLEIQGKIERHPGNQISRMINTI